MSRKSHTLPEQLLAMIVASLEREDVATTEILSMLFAAGPLDVENPRTLLDQVPVDELPAIRGELMAFLRSVAARRASDTRVLLRRARAALGEAPAEPTSRYFSTIGTYRAMTFTATAWGACTVTGDAHDIAVLQLILLVQDVGLAQVRICPAPGCGRLFVKTYRREYCGRACQNREFMRRTRDEDRERKEYRARAARRRKRAKGA